MIRHRKPRFSLNESRSHKALLSLLITKKLVTSHTYNKTYWIPSDDYLEIFFSMNLYFFHERILKFHELTNSLASSKYVFTSLFYVFERLRLRRYFVAIKGGYSVAGYDLSFFI